MSLSEISQELIQKNLQVMWQTWQQVSGSLLNDWGNRWLLEAALGYFTTYLLVLVRLSGLMIIGPYFGHEAIPVRVRVLLAFSLSLMVTSCLPNIQERGFQQLDLNQDGLLTAHEIPRGLHEASMMSGASYETASVSRLEFRQIQGVPSTVFDLAWLAGTELVIGMLLGFGVLVILAGLQLAGETFDQQAGTALSEIFNPSLGTSSTPTGQLMFLMGTTVLLVMLPFDGHLMMLMSLMKTFEVIPVGLAWIDVSTLDVLRHLVSQSLVIAIQIAAPLLAAMALLSVAMGFLGFTVPQINVLVLGFPIRALLCTAILLITFSGASEAIVDLFPQVLEQITDSLYSAGK